MPWFPDFVAAAELARKQTRDDGLQDPAMHYLDALNGGDAHLLEQVWPGDVVVHDPKVGTVKGHRELRAFVKRNHEFLAAHHTRTEKVASTAAGDRAVYEILAHLTDDDGREISWPVAVVAESSDDLSVEFRSYCAVWPALAQPSVRPAILGPDDVRFPGSVGRYQSAIAAGDVDAVTSAFEADGYYREAFGSDPLHRGTSELRAFFERGFAAGGGIGLEPCAVTDDGVCCALEYNLTRWGRHPVPSQAGLLVHERGPDGLLAAVRAYDDIAPPPEVGAGDQRSADR